jgi:hypothetical protein
MFCYMTLASLCEIMLLVAIIAVWFNPAYGTGFPVAVETPVTPVLSRV